MSRSTIENLYGTLPRSRSQSISSHSSKESEEEVPIVLSDNVLKRNRSLENEELLNAATSALAKFLRRRESFTKSPGIDESLVQSEGFLSETSELEESDVGSLGGTGAILNERGNMVVDKETVKDFVQELEKRTVSPSEIILGPRKGNFTRSKSGRKKKTTNLLPEKKATIEQPGCGSAPHKKLEVATFPPTQITVDHITTQKNSSMDLELHTESLFDERADNCSTCSHTPLGVLDGRDSAKSRQKPNDNMIIDSSKSTSRTILVAHLDDDGDPSGSATFGSSDLFCDPVVSRRKCILVGNLVAVLLLGSVSLLVWILFRVNAVGSSGRTTKEDLGIESPVFKPTTFGPSSLSIPFVSDVVLEEFGDKSHAQLQDPNSPQYKAASWMASKDFAFSFPLSKDVSIRKAFRQRFALATLFYSTEGPTSWRETYDFVSPVHECEWMGDGNRDGIVCLNNNVVEIRIPQNGLRGSIPEEILGLEDLEVFDLRQNSITGRVPDGVYRLSNLRHLMLAYNQISGSLSNELSTLKNLRTLWIEDSAITGSIPSGIRHLSSLVRVNLARGKLTGPIPSGLQALSSLRDLDLSFNRMVGFLPTELAELPRMESILLSGNQFSGQIPAGNYESLRSLEVGSNRFDGTIPSHLFKETLRNLDLQDNLLSGELPLSWFRSSSLLTVNLSKNQFIGGLPSTLGSLTKLVTLIASSCGLTGTLPSELANTKLEILQLNHNGFVGTVPLSYTRLPLFQFSIESNLIRSDISNSICTIPTLEFATADCRVQW